MKVPGKYHLAYILVVNHICRWLKNMVCKECLGRSAGDRIFGRFFLFNHFFLSVSEKNFNFSFLILAVGQANLKGKKVSNSFKTDLNNEMEQELNLPMLAKSFNQNQCSIAKKYDSYLKRIGVSRKSSKE